MTGLSKSFTVQIDITITEEDLSTLLSNAFEGVGECGCAWAKPTDQGAYDSAREELVSERGSANGISDMDVYARMLMRGGTIQCLDPESNWHWSGHKPGEMLWAAQIWSEGCEPVGGEWHAIGLDDIAEAIRKYAEGHVASDLGANLSKIVEDGDFWDADAIIQYAMYGDVIYG